MANRVRRSLSVPRLLCSALVCAALGSLAPAPGQNAPAQEMTTQESGPTFKLEVERNLVLVRVVVRDSHGEPVPNLRKQDFQLFDSGKQQTLSVFSVEEPASRPVGWESEAERQADFEAAPSKTEAASAHRFLGLYVDDQHISWEDLARTREAAIRFLSTALQPGDRVGIFTSSGQNVVDFTDDYEKIKQDLLLLRDRALTTRENDACPDILDYQAFKIVHLHDPDALLVATQEAYACRYSNDPVLSAQDAQQLLAMAQSEAQTDAFHILSMSEYGAESALRGLDELIRHMAAFPGERNIVLISPGFLTDTLKSRLGDVVDRAIRANVIINTFDARGLYTLALAGDATRTTVVIPRDANVLGLKALIRNEELQHVTEVLSETAEATGGVYFHNSNDLDEGFRRAGSLPEVYYVLGFSPSQLKYDGRFHPLKVTLSTPNRFTLQARRGYFVPSSPPDSAAKAKEDIREAAFSRDEVHELPVHVSTQFFKFNDTDTRLSVLTRVDMRLVRFRKEEGRNLNNLTFVTVLFDRDGKYITAKEKTVEFHLRDASLEKLGQSGLTSRANFDLKPGTYLVRQVVRDAEGGQISALNRTVEIPY